MDVNICLEINKELKAKYGVNILPQRYVKQFYNDVTQFLQWWNPNISFKYSFMLLSITDFIINVCELLNLRVFNIFQSPQP